MNIELREITIRELANGYQDNAENGVVGFGGKCNESASKKTGTLKTVESK